MSIKRTKSLRTAALGLTRWTPHLSDGNIILLCTSPFPLTSQINWFYNSVISYLPTPDLNIPVSFKDIIISSTFSFLLVNPNFYLIFLFSLKVISISDSADLLAINSLRFHWPNYIFISPSSLKGIVCSLMLRQDLYFSDGPFWCRNWMPGALRRC